MNSEHVHKLDGGTWSSLERLDLSQNPWGRGGDGGVALAAAFTAWPLLRSLFLRETDMEPSALNALLKGKSNQLEEANMSFNMLGLRGARSLAERGPGSWPNLKNLVLVYN